MSSDRVWIWSRSLTSHRSKPIDRLLVGSRRKPIVACFDCSGLRAPAPVAALPPVNRLYSDEPGLHSGKRGSVVDVIGQAWNCDEPPLTSGLTMLVMLGALKPVP